MIEYLVVAIVLAYAFLITQFIIGWFRIKKFNIPDQWVPTTKVSVVIAFKNEKENLGSLINDLRDQNYPHHLVEYIFVNDHSTDEGDLLIKDLAAKDSRFTLLNGEGRGKKSSLDFGYKHAKGKLFVSIDADCNVGKDWLPTIVAYYESYHPKLIINPVRFSFGKRIWDKIQAIEFQSVMASAAGSVGAKMPILISGANLAFEASVLKTSKDVMNRNFESGDDMFLLEYVKKHHPGSIGYLKSKKAFSVTQPNPDLKTFVNQRSRWTSKSGGYSDLHIIMSGLIVAGMNFLIFPGILISIWNPAFLHLVLFAWAVKCIVDIILLVSTARFFQNQKLIGYILPISVIYSFYVFWVTLLGLLGKFKWK